MAELRSLLSFMDAEDRVRVLRYYDSLFDKAGEDGEDALIASLGSPVRQVLRVEKQYREILEQEEDEEYSPATPVAPEPALFPETRTEEAFEKEEPEEETLTAPVRQLVTDAPPPADTAAAYAGVVLTASVFAEAPEAAPAERQAATAVGCAPREERIEPDEQPDRDEQDERDDRDEQDDLDQRDDEERDDSPVFRDTAGPGAGRVVGAVFVTIPVIPFVALGMALSLAVALLALAPGVALGAAAGYIWGYVFGGVMGFLPDILLLGGLLLLCAAFSLLLLWLGIWLAVGGAKLTVRIVASIYRAILSEGGAEHE